MTWSGVRAAGLKRALYRLPSSSKRCGVEVLGGALVLESELGCRRFCGLGSHLGQPEGAKCGTECTVHVAQRPSTTHNFHVFTSMTLHGMEIYIYIYVYMHGIHWNIF